MRKKTFLRLKGFNNKQLTLQHKKKEKFPVESNGFTLVLEQHNCAKRDNRKKKRKKDKNKIERDSTPGMQSPTWMEM